MTIFELGALGEFFGSIAVVVTLIFLILQIRQNTNSMDASRKVAMAMAYQSRAEAAQDMTLRIAESKDLSVIMEKLEAVGFPNDPNSINSLDALELRRVRAIMLAQQIRVDNQFYQYQHGMLDEEYYDSNFKMQVGIMAPGLAPAKLTDKAADF